jgi:Spy/CpxP family protein refolding chaperone
MRHRQKHNGRILTLLTLLAVIGLPGALASVSAQNGQQSATAEPQQGGDLIRQLNLTPEQREQIRSIREDKKAERVEVNQRLRDANVALEAALDADLPDEAVIDQRVRDLATAQAAVMRMRLSTEIRIRRVLNPEQRALLRSLQRQARDLQRERRLANPVEKPNQRAERRALQNQNNGLGPLLPRRRP